MKKKRLTIFLFLCLLIILINRPFISANNHSKLEENLGNLKNIQNIAIDKNLHSEYLKQEWSKLLNKSSVGPYLTKTKEVIQFIDPALNLLLGINFTFSWFFFLTLVIWISFLVAVFNILILVEVYFKPEKYAKHAKWGSWLIFLIFISTVRIPKYFSDFIISTISLAKNWGIQLILFLIITIIIIFLSRYTKMIKKKFTAIKTEKTIKSNKEEIATQKEKKEKLRINSQDMEYKKESIKEEAEEQAREELEGISKEDN